MSRHAAVLGRFVGGITLAAALLCCPDLLPAQEGAEQAAAPETIDVQLATDGTYGSFRPVARVTIDRPGHVALFELEPGVGATMLYPDDPDDPKRYAAGTHLLHLNGLPVAVRRRLMTWHLGRAFAHRPLLVPDNHLVAVVSDEPLDLSDLHSDRIFEHARSRAGAGAVAEALLASVAGDLSPQAWDAAYTSYGKFRDPALLATSGPWLDAPFLPLARELAFTGWPPPGIGDLDITPSPGFDEFLFTCGPAFAATGEFFVARTAHDLNVCRHAVPDRRLLADLNWEDPAERTQGKAAAADERDPPGSDGSEAEHDEGASSRSGEPLPVKVREALRRIADATRPSRRLRDSRSRLHLEMIGRAMSARGFGVDSERLGRLRWKAEARARNRGRIGGDPGGFRGLPAANGDVGVDRPSSVGGGDRGIGSAGGSAPSARPAGREVQPRSPNGARRPTPPARKPSSSPPRRSGDDARGN